MFSSLLLSFFSILGIANASSFENDYTNDFAYASS